MRPFLLRIIQAADLVLCTGQGFDIVEFGYKGVIRADSIEYQSWHTVKFEHEYGSEDRIISICLVEGEEVELVSFVKEHGIPLFYGRITCLAEPSSGRQEDNPEYKRFISLDPKVNQSLKDVVEAVTKYQRENGLKKRLVIDRFRDYFIPFDDLEAMGDGRIDGMFAMDAFLSGMSALLVSLIIPRLIKHGELDENEPIGKCLPKIIDSLDFSCNNLMAHFDDVDITTFLMWLMELEDSEVDQYLDWGHYEAVKKLYDRFSKERSKRLENTRRQAKKK